MCREDVYEDELITHVLTENDKYNVCSWCTEKHFTARPNMAYMSRVKSSIAFFARYKDSYCVFHTFAELYEFVTRENTLYYLCTFGCGAMAYLTHSTPAEALHDLAELRKRVCQTMWDHLPEKTKESTIYIPKRTFKEQVMYCMDEKANDIYVKRQKLEDALRAYNE